MPRPVRQSHRLAGSWAYDHGVAADLSRNASTRVNVLTIVSAIRQSVQACAADRGWPYLRLRELRVCAHLACEMHRRFRLRNCQLSPESKATSPKDVEYPSGCTWSDSACGITLRSGEPQRSLLRQQRTPSLLERADGTASGLAITARPSGRP